MSNASQPFDFSQFVPGFDFLKNLAGGAAGGSGGGAAPGLPGLASWVAPTLSVEEVDKRIQELKTVQYWLEQNGHALKATIQALEVQKMTLSTLRGMNVRMEDIANAFTKQAAAVAPAAAAPVEPEPEAEPEEEAPAEAAAPARKARSKPASSNAASTGNGGVVDPMQWWGSLTEQFQQIASSALQDAAQLKVPAMAQPVADAVDKAMGKPAASAASKPAAKKAAATPAAKKKAPGAARKRAASRR
ncbi:hypothetical protein ASC78_04725 [Variovorax sp. Root318D1]|uniref:PhaM family polyhydroxyalkanoate granule multifunctional regulatory protein n=1 Tax=Variovorax sp. Root318D1 TaxID=1736513 RepID=UPI0006FAA5CE|nr:PhaM family polyhydroxyalkanoate granule multifunctional regulatory protein [Variovorax sp. Root318D1]KQU86863.1 hypothetical protein ASC78_04725 [Variovorax sp. Root318D1]